MERRQLECFLAVADCGNMSEASRKLHISQPALSQTIKALEQSVGTPLFHRLPRGVKLTSAGESLRTPAQQILRDFETASKRIQSVRGLTSGSLDLVSLPGLMYAPLASLLSLYSKHWPEVRIKIELVETPAAVTEMVRSGVAELGLTIDTPGSEDLEAVRIDTQELVAVMPSHIASRISEKDPEISRDRYGVTLQELMDAGLIAGRPGTLIRDLADQQAAESGREWHPVIEVERREAAIAFVRAGAGVSVLPQSINEAARSYGLRVFPLRPRIRRPVSLLHRRSPLSPSATALAKLTSTVHQAR